MISSFYKVPSGTRQDKIKLFSLEKTALTDLVLKNESFHITPLATISRILQNNRMMPTNLEFFEVSISISFDIQLRIFDLIKILFIIKSIIIFCVSIFLSTQRKLKPPIDKSSLILLRFNFNAMFLPFFSIEIVYVRIFFSKYFITVHYMKITAD